MYLCPRCEGDLGDMDPVMDKLRADKLNGEYFFDSPCCHTPLRAYSFVGSYSVEQADGSGQPKLLGTD